MGNISLPKRAVYMDRRHFLEGGVAASLLGALAACSSSEEASTLDAAIRIVPTIEALRQLVPQEGEVVYTEGYHQAGDGGGGGFRWAKKDTRAPDGGMVVESEIHSSAEGGRWVRVRQGQRDVYLARHFGAHPERKDNTGAIQAAINAAEASGGTAYVSSGTYRIAGTLLVKPGMALEGAEGASTTLIKTSRRRGHEIRRYNRLYDVYDEYNVDSIVSVDRPDESLNYSQYVVLRNLRLSGLASETGEKEDRNSYGLYAPRLSKACLENVSITQVEQGFYFREIIVSRLNQCVANYVRIGFHVDKEGGGGTSTTFQACYASRAEEWGYLLRSMSYTSLNSCACDHAGSVEGGGGYFIELGHGISLISCGCEGSYGPVLRVSHSEVTISGFRTNGIKGGKGQSAYVRVKDAKVIFIGCSFDEMNEPGQARNARYLGQSHVTFLGSEEPKGGRRTAVGSNATVLRQ